MNNERISLNCDFCGSEIKENPVEVNGEYYCTECAEEHTFVCECCGRRYPDEELNWVEGDAVCDECYEDNTFTCECCEDRFYNRHDNGNETISLCSHCRNYHYYTCDECGELMHEDDVYWYHDTPYCGYCYDNVQNEYIHDYCYKPEPKFHGFTKIGRYYGVELEISGAGEDEGNAKKLLDILNPDNDEDYAYIKHDGSLSAGMEIVSHPMTIDFHRLYMDWERFMKKAIELGYRSHQTRCCGLHVHVSREAFGEDEYEQEKSIAKLMYFIELHWAEFFKFSRRTRENIDEWARPWGAEESPSKLMDKIKSGYVGRKRYHNINLENSNTVEFRFFRGTLRYKTFMATLQLIDKLVDVAINYSYEDIALLSWLDFVSLISEPELIQYLKERRLYINENINESEEF